MSVQKKSDLSLGLEDLREPQPLERAAPAEKGKSVFRLSKAELDELEGRVMKLACVAMTFITLIGILAASLAWLIKELVWLIKGPTP